MAIGLHFDNILGTVTWQGMPVGAPGGIISGSWTTPSGAVAVRDAVYVSAPGEVSRADADDPLKAPAVGFVVQVSSPTACVVQYYGEIAGFVGLTPGATYFLSTTPGGITTSAPALPGIVQELGFAKSATTLVATLDRDVLE